METSGAVKHDVSVTVRPELQGNLPYVVTFQKSGIHGLRHEIGDRVQSGRTLRTEVIRIATGIGPRLRKNIVEDTGALEGIVNVSIHAAGQTNIPGPAHRAGFDITEELGELPVNHKIEQCFPLGKVVIDGHRSNTDRL